MTEYSVIPPSGEYNLDWPDNLVLPQGKGGSVSSAGWTEGNEGFAHQTFLGASIRSFDINAGFGDSSTQLSVDLVDDQYNTSDHYGIGRGDDIYHNGTSDNFRPPVVGTPVYFKFGKNFATIDQAYRKTLDETYGYNTVSTPINYPTVTTTGDITKVPGHNFYLRDTTGTGANAVHTWVDKSSLNDPNNYSRGKDHFVFGGILQGYTQNRGSNGNPLYSVQVTDPREILSNAVVILNNYQGTTFNNKNLFNVYGFLEYDVSDELKEKFEGTDAYPNPSLISKDILEKSVDSIGNITYVGDDTYSFDPMAQFTFDALPPSFPITGQGFSRRGDQGMPWYRIHQGLDALFSFNGALPEEYTKAGFGGTIDFRGYKYVVDFGGIPLDKIPKMYFMQFDQLDMMSLAQELCDVISHDLFVSLLPVIDHPAFFWLYNYNQYVIDNGRPTDVIAGVIRVDTIDRSVQPDYGSIKSYIDNLAVNGVEVENQDVGFELSNVTTDKFVVGANEVEMAYFTNHRDRNNLQLFRKNKGLENDYELLEEIQWEMDTSLKQQILPFYGFLGKNSVSIPRGFGSYQQILLDTQHLFAYGVGNYYVATELELRIALKSYESWSNFLSNYDELFMEDVAADRMFYKSLINSGPENVTSDDIDDYVAKYTGGTTNERIKKSLEALANGNYALTVPRCLFNSDKDFMGPDGYPASPCSPPYGYPLYYKRAEKIGIAKAGAVSFSEPYLQLQTNFETFKKTLSEKPANDVPYPAAFDGLREAHKKLRKGKYGDLNLNHLTTEYQKLLETGIQDAKDMTDEYMSAITALGGAIKSLNYLNNYVEYQKTVKSIGLNGEKNAKKVYEFIRGVAEENLGKKFLVKIPKSCNLAYDKMMELDDQEVELERGPFGFKPDPINADAGYASSDEFNTEISGILDKVQILSQGTFGVPSSKRELFNHYLDHQARDEYTYGALKNNYNPISEKWEFNYDPEPQGGFFNFAVFDRNLSFTESASMDEEQLPPASLSHLAPRDLTNIVDLNGRMKCYVRYNNSQFLDMSAVSKDKITQQKVTRNGYIPDVLEELENTNPDYRFSLDRIKNMEAGQIERSVSFVTCDVDPNFYLTPEIQTSSVLVYGRTYEWVHNEKPIDLIETTDDNGCKAIKPFIEDVWKVFRPGRGGGVDGKMANNTDFKRVYKEELDAWIIDTEEKNLDPEHVYALITVPGRIKPVIDSRYLDADSYTVNPQIIKHRMTQDVVRGPAGFEKPAPVINRDEFDFPCPGEDTLTAANSANLFARRIGIENAFGETFLPDPDMYKQFSTALNAQKEAMSAAANNDLSFNVSKSQPSPVYPDLVALPLRSNERCYGPWLSASILTSDNRVRYTDIGGRIEFAKDENLAPWNFAGYQLMNEAGSLKAQFSNSLLLFSERGGFTIPEAPTGISIAGALNVGGPLVTSINVSISDGGFKTDVKMDLYTSQFGKLQKQKEDLIAKIARERQKIIDQNNSMMKQGIGKSVSNVDLLAPIRDVGAILQTAADQSERTLRKSLLGMNNIQEVQSRQKIQGRDAEGNILERAVDTIKQTFDVTKDGDIDVADAFAGVKAGWDTLMKATKKPGTSPGKNRQQRLPKQ